MAIAKLNPILAQLSGQVGDLVFKHYGDRVVITKKPDMSRVTPSRAQETHRERFARAVAYSRRVLTDPEARAAYEVPARAAGKSVYGMTISDFFHPPSVDAVDLSLYTGVPGDPIPVIARDDVQVRRVTVSICTEDGTQIEAGEAVRVDGDARWAYATTVAVAAGATVRVTATATDLPGGEGDLEQVWTVG
ncbi:MAG: hypothetical protein HY684_02415 [Chloroflexi bacterium]|nr:hypothetical protein [Chloroflexota bacterium]